MRSGKSSSLGYYTIAVAALFLTGFLLLVIFGAGSFQTVLSAQRQNVKTRSVLSYLATSVKNNDASGSVSVREEETGPVLVIADGASGYAQRIYRIGDDLVEDLAPLSSPLSPDNAEIIGPAGRFEIAFPMPGLLEISTDEGTVLVRIHSEGGVR